VQTADRGLEVVAVPDRIQGTMGWKRIVAGLGSVLLAVGLARAATSTELDSAVRSVRAVAAEGKGNADAAAAWKVLAGAQASEVPVLLVAMDGANDYALNWLRAAVETVVQRGAAVGNPVSVPALESFLRDTSHHPRGRRLAFELIQRNQPERATTLLPEFLNDPGTELRRAAVAQLEAAAAARAVAGDKAGALEGYRRALGYAREADQIDGLARKLGEFGEKVDLRETLGWVTRWRVMGPFDNTGGAGFARAFPPEEALDLAAETEGKTGKVRWQEFESKDDYGWVDFNRPFSPIKEVTAYAWTDFWSETNRPVEIRLGSENGWKVWLNGKLVFGRDEYHRASEMDQYRMPVELKAGRNTLLVKCCQNEQVEEWTKGWEFQLRVTDAQGTPIRSSK
jgi:hypothetical protein